MARTKLEQVEAALSDAPTEDEAEAPAAPEQVLVRWVGYREDLSHVRRIFSTDWMTVGVAEENDTVWDTTDPMTRGQALVSPRAAEYLLEIEKGFEVVPDDERAFAFRQ